MRLLRFLPPAMLVLHLFLPLCRLLAQLVEMEFILYHPLIYQIVVTVVFLAVTVALVIKDVPGNLLFLLLVPAAMFDGAAWFRTGELSVLLALVNTVCALVLAFRCTGWGKAVVAALCIPMMLILMAAGCIKLWVGGLSGETVVYELESPSGERIVRVISSNQGAMGGSTVVEVQRQFRQEVLIGAFIYSPQQVYVGDWGEFEQMNIQWRDEHTLNINGKYYAV